MKAVGFFEYGGPEVLQTVELPDPHAGRGQVRIRVRAAAVNPTDIMLRKGAFRDRDRDLPPPFVPGMDVAGTIDEVGEGVDPAYGLNAGDDVVAIVENRGSHGGYSEWVVVPAASTAPKPRGTTFPEAASFLMNALTARSVLDALGLAPGATLLVTGAAGALGGYVTQLGAAEGLRVIALASAADEAQLRDWGADVVIPRGEEPLIERIRAVAPGGVNAVADAALLHERIVPAIRDGGHLAVVRRWTGDPGRGITVHAINVRARATDHAAITRLAKQVEMGRLTPRVAATYPFTQAADAHRRFEQGGLRGRLILRFADAPSSL